MDMKMPRMNGLASGTILKMEDVLIMMTAMEK